MKIARKKAARAFGLLLLAPIFLLTGCFATQQDIEPMQSDIMVLEKQFSEVQKQVAKAKYAEEGQAEPEKLKEIDNRISALEKRMDSLDAQIREMKENQAPLAPQPIPPESNAPAPAAPAAPAPQAPQPTKGMVAAQDAFNQAMDLYSAGDYENAKAKFSAFLRNYPTDNLADDARFMLGEIAFTRKDYAGAVKEYQKVVDDYPLADRVPDALYKEGTAYELMGNPDKARESFNRVMDNYPYSDSAKKAHHELDKLKGK